MDDATRFLLFRRRRPLKNREGYHSGPGMRARRRRSAFLLQKGRKNETTSCVLRGGPGERTKGSEERRQRERKRDREREKAGRPQRSSATVHEQRHHLSALRFCPERISLLSSFPRTLTPRLFFVRLDEKRDSPVSLVPSRAFLPPRRASSLRRGSFARSRAPFQKRNGRKRGPDTVSAVMEGDGMTQRSTAHIADTCSLSGSNSRRRGRKSDGG